MRMRMRVSDTTHAEETLDGVDIVDGHYAHTPIDHTGWI